MTAHDDAATEARFAATDAILEHLMSPSGSVCSCGHAYQRDRIGGHVPFAQIASHYAGVAVAAAAPILLAEAQADREAERGRWKAEVERALRERDAVAASHREWEQRTRNAEAEMRGMERGREAILTENARMRAERSPGCRAQRDGECHWTSCPQVRDGEPRATGRHCPLDNRTAPEEG